jgi:hypothetical protein
MLDVCTLDCNVMSDASTHEPGSECRSCPVCLVLQALQEVRPEVRAHLVAAGRELVLALRAAVASDHERGRPPDAAPDPRPDREGERRRAGVPESSDHVGAHGDSRRLRRIDIQ